jgi:hypothetical protein
VLQIEKWVVRMVYLRIKSDSCGCSDGNLGLFGKAAADDMKKRPHSGNGCTQCALTGHAALSSDYRIGQCVRGVADPELYEYTNRNCRVKNGTGVGGPDERARVHGHQLAVKLDEGGGQWVLVEAFDEDGDGDEVWLAR